MSDKRQVLVIDDEDTVTHVITSTLIGAGYQVFTAHDGVEGFEKAQRINPDIILLDIMMPDIDGYEVLNRLRSEPATSNVPVIFITARIENDERVHGLEAGAVDYITKPFYPQELLARIRIHLRLKEYEEELTKKNRELEDYSDLLLQLNARLEEMARIDELTEIGNRRAFNEQITSTHSYSKRYMHPYSIIIVDLDHFKNYNDVYGHLMGDAVLKKVAETISKICRSTDFVSRYGGEEIVILLRETDLPSSQPIAERIIKAIEQLDIPHTDNEGYGRVTASAGVAAYRPHQNLEELWSEVLKRADIALYAAKETGRNRVCGR